MPLVGLTNDEAFTLARREFYLYREDVSADCPMGRTDGDSLSLLDVPDLKRVSAVKCTVRNRVSENAQRPFWAGNEGKVFGIDVRVSMNDGTPDKERNGVFLLKVFSDKEGVVCTDTDGRDRLRRTQYLCEPANSLHRVAGTFLHGENEDLFAGAPILVFSHHLGLEERKNKGEAFVCYIMKNAGVPRKSFTADNRTSVRRWSELRNELLRPRDRIALARDLACAVHMLHERHIQHCDLSPENVLIIHPADPALELRLALIDFDSFYNPHVPSVQSHKQYLFSFEGPMGARAGHSPSPTLRGIFQGKGRCLSELASIEEATEKYYLIRDPLAVRRPANYLVEAGQGTNCGVWLLGAPGHVHYQAPIDLLAGALSRERYDNFAMGAMIHEILCWLHTEYDGALIEQTLINALNGDTSQRGVVLCGPARFILHKHILDLLDRVFSCNCTRWPEPKDWAFALRNGPVYRVCPGPMRAGWRWPMKWIDRMHSRRRRNVGMRSRSQRPCLWPLPQMKGIGMPSWFSRKAEPAQRLKCLAHLDAEPRENLLAQKGLKEDAEFCAVCGCSLRLDVPERQ